MRWLSKIFGHKGKVSFEGKLKSGGMFDGCVEINGFNASKSSIELCIKRQIAEEKGLDVEFVRLTDYRVIQ